MTFHRLKSHWFSLLLTCLLLGMAGIKFPKGMVWVEGIDLAMPYSCTRAWLAGADPYDAQTLHTHFKEAGGHGIEYFDMKILPPIYPPITFIVMTPIALLPWEQALRVWQIAGPVMVGLLIAALMQLIGLRWRDPRTLLLILFCIVFSPTRSAVTLAQNAIPAVCLAMLAMVALGRRLDGLCGVLLALAIGFKLQDALFAAVYLVLMRRWRAIAFCVGVLALMSMVAIARPGLSDPGWIFGVLHWIRQASVPGAIIDPAPPNGARFQMIHLPVLLFTFLSNRTVVAAANLIICGILIVAACVMIVRNRHEPRTTPDLLSLGTLGVLSLLPFYHRFPDAIMLLLPMAWAISRLGKPNEIEARVVLVLLLPFLIQPYEVLRSLVTGGRLSRAVYDAWWFACFVRASLVWLLLLMAAWLVYVLAVENRRQGISPIPPPDGPA